MDRRRGVDRRLRARFRAHLPLLLKGASQEVEGTTRNVSLLGVSAYAKGPLPQAEPVQCILELPSESKPIIATGTIIHCEALTQPLPEGSHEVGVFFKEFQEPGESTLAKFLEQISHKEESALKAGYQALKQKLAARKRRKQLEALRKRRRRLARLRRRRQRLAREKKRLAAKRLAKKKSKRRAKKKSS
ncbi:MAG: PilZ domain-containing protein [Candidatus Omnitrophica bacterium]|nr:PilZ domain-containing protein [Candidatus Omnitrophota bacterium]